MERDLRAPGAPGWAQPLPHLEALRGRPWSWASSGMAQSPHSRCAGAPPCMQGSRLSVTEQIYRVTPMDALLAHLASACLIGCVYERFWRSARSIASFERQGTRVRVSIAAAPSGAGELSPGRSAATKSPSVDRVSQKASSVGLATRCMTASSNLPAALVPGRCSAHQSAAAPPAAAAAPGAPPAAT